MVKSSAKHSRRWGGGAFRFRLRSFRFDRNFSVRRFSITEAALLLLMAYIASKGLGAVRQILFNSLFGTGPAATAYYAAFRLPDTIFNLIAGGALTHAFIPVLLSYEKERGERESWRLISLVFNVLLVSLVALLLIAEFIAPTFVNSILVPGLSPSVRNLTTTLTRIMLLQPLILGIGTVATAVLHRKRQFFPSALAIVIYDLGPIVGLLLARAIPGVGIYGPAFGLLASALCQVVVQIPGVIRQGAHYTFTWNLKDPGLRQVLRLLGPNALSVGIGSAGAIVITSFASYLPDKASIAALHNANLLFALPLTLVTLTIGNALLPPLSAQATHGRYVRMSGTILKILGGSALLSVVAAIVLYVLGKPAIHILFQYGAFNAHASELTNLALIGYAVGLPGMTVGALSVLCFYALKDAWTPFFANAVALAAQIGLTFLLLKTMTGINTILALPLAASLTGTAEAGLLCLILYVRLRAKMKTDKGMRRLRQRRKYASRLQEPQPAGRAAMAETTLPLAAVASQSFRPVQQAAAAGSTSSLTFPAALQRVEPSIQQTIMTEATAPIIGVLPILPSTPILPAAMAQISLPLTPREGLEALEPAQQMAPMQNTSPLVIDASLVEYQHQRVLHVDPGNLMSLVRWHIAMMTRSGTEVTVAFEVLNRVCWLLRHEGKQDLEAITREYGQAAAANHNNATIHYAWGHLLQEAGDYDKPIDAYMTAMHSSALEGLARFSIAQCLLLRGQPQAAIEQLEQTLQLVRYSLTGSDDTRIWAVRPREEGEERQNPEVEISALLVKVYGYVHPPEKKNKQASSGLLSRAKQTLPHQDEASAPSAEVSAHQENAASVLQEYIDLVHTYRDKRETENALRVLHEMVHLAPQEPWAYDELADIYENCGLLDEAIEELRALAFIYLRRNQIEQAGTIVGRIGKLYVEMGHTEEAFANLQRAVEFAPDDIELLREMVSFCLKVGRSKDAVHYQEVIARHFFGSFYIGEAVAALQQLIAIDVNNVEAYDLLGQTYQSVGEYEQAIRVYRRLARIAPESSVAREHLAWLTESGER